MVATTTADQTLFIFTDENGNINFRGNIFTEEFNKYCEQLEKKFSAEANEVQEQEKRYLTFGDLLKSIGVILVMLIMLFVVGLSLIIGMALGLVINLCRWVYGIFDRANQVKVF